MSYQSSFYGDNYQPEYQPYKFGGKELDAMHGLNWADFDSRYYDGIVPRFTTPDPLAEKHYSISPYAYCANNPVNAIDPTGEDYIIYIDLETKRITVTATYYAATQDLKSAEKAAEDWNNQSDQFFYKTRNGNKFKVNFDITVSEVKTDANLSFTEKRDAVLASTNADRSGNANAYIVVPEDRMDDNLNGRTVNGKYISVKESRSATETGAHEMGHSLGLVHGGSGLMNPSSSERQNDNVRTDDIKDMVNYPITNRINKERNPATGKDANAGKGIFRYTPNSAELPPYFYYHKKNKVNRK
jgi:RHS repeat-associated protein